MTWARSSKLPLSFVAACAAIVIGCGESAPIAPSNVSRPQPAAQTASDSQPAPLEVAPVVTAASVPPNVRDATPGVTPTLAEEPSAAATAAYEPPFPDRVDLFVPPKRQGGVLQDVGSEDAIVLLGFVRLDQPHAVLSINGQITRIAEGDSQHGIEVISIQSPKAVLQRGRQRWQASLEN